MCSARPKVARTDSRSMPLPRGRLRVTWAVCSMSPVIGGRSSIALKLTMEISPYPSIPPPIERHAGAGVVDRLQLGHRRAGGRDELGCARRLEADEKLNDEHRRLVE